MAKNKIDLKSFEKIRLEYKAGGAVTPGMIVELNSSDQIIAHSNAGQNVAPVYVAEEQELEGKGIDDDYSSGDRALVWIPRRGDEGYMWLSDGENASKYDLLESAGDGRLAVHSAGSAGEVEHPNAIVGQALEAVDATVSNGVHQRIKVRFV